MTILEELQSKYNKPGVYEEGDTIFFVDAWVEYEPASTQTHTVIYVNGKAYSVRLGTKLHTGFYRNLAINGCQLWAYNKSWRAL